MNETKFNLLLIEDDQPLAELTKEYLDDFEFVTTWVETGEEARAALNANSFDLIICDVNLPDIQGFELIEQLALPVQLPVLFLTALSDNDSQITGLNSGACDYIVKPVEPVLLLARIRAHLRHSHPAAAGDIIHIGDLKLDNLHKQMDYNDVNIKLTNQEFELIWFFVAHGDNVISREVIFLDLIGRAYDGVDRSADLRVSRFRKKWNPLVKRIVYRIYSQ
ncbi:response regulator transcription factor [Psychrosphaera algicola]|uniref:Response regulator transcription factor n=1 Tax=Psychrosphaera algicola TaxID=3023714 RepID=A0ABT5FB55_9GAMM|nr:response regulator transcription factor [Psychrosphaera sp. G1-22]MDC2888750.1 response regulator transcription factor [Psychrosphaera sp. G1-22]